MILEYKCESCGTDIKVDTSQTMGEHPCPNCGEVLIIASVKEKFTETQAVDMESILAEDERERLKSAQESIEEEPADVFAPEQPTPKAFPHSMVLLLITVVSIVVAASLVIVLILPHFLKKGPSGPEVEPDHGEIPINVDQGDKPKVADRLKQQQWSPLEPTVALYPEKVLGNARRGHPRAQAILSGYYRVGDMGFEMNRDNALMWAEKAVGGNDALGKFQLGMLYRQDTHDQSLQQLAERLLKEAREEMADTDRPSLSDALGTMCELGLGGPEELEKAFKLHEKPALLGFTNAQYNLGQCYERGIGVAQDTESALTWFRKAAQKGHVGAQFVLGRYYESGVGVPKDFTQAVRWYQLSAASHCHPAQYRLGNCFYNGSGIAKNYEEAIAWYKKAAKAGIPEAQYKLGLCCLLGHGTEANPEEAFGWLLKATEQSYPPALVETAQCYEKGKGVHKDTGKAFGMYLKAAEMNHVPAFYHLGLCFEQGIGTEKSLAKAVTSYLNAAEKGNAEAQIKLASLYEAGKGVPHDLKQALEWNAKALRQGNPQASIQRKQLEAKFEREQKVVARQSRQEQLNSAVRACLSAIDNPKSFLALERLLEKSDNKETRYRLSIACFLASVVREDANEAKRLRQMIQKRFPERQESNNLYFEQIFKTCVCGGTGKITETCPVCKGRKTCPRCGGTGHYGDSVLGVYKCSRCKGSGKCPKCGNKGVITIQCPVCFGKGKFASKDRAAVELQKLLKAYLEVDQVDVENILLEP